MKTCKFCLKAVSRLSDCDCGGWNKKRSSQNAIRSKRYNQRHTFWRILKHLRKKKLQDNITTFQLWQMAKRQKLICPLTGEKLTNENISIDHIIPICKGGSQSLENLRFTTKQANLSKHVLTDEQFVELCKKVINNRSLRD